MNLTLIERLNIDPSAVDKRAFDIFEYYERIELILEETYAALGERSRVGVSSSLTSTNTKIDVKFSGAISKTEVIARLA